MYQSSKSLESIWFGDIRIASLLFINDNVTLGPTYRWVTKKLKIKNEVA